MTLNVKLYYGSVHNQHVSLSKCCTVDHIASTIDDEKILNQLDDIDPLEPVNFWDVGSWGTSILEEGSILSVVCRDYIYTGEIMRMIFDPSGSVGDVIGWSRFQGLSWSNPLILKEVTVVTKPYIATCSLLNALSARKEKGLLVINDQNNGKVFLNHAGYTEDHD
jgi:hypothetical protein